MDEPIRIQLSRRKGFRMQAQSPDGREVVKVARPTKWGNPFTKKDAEKARTFSSNEWLTMYFEWWLSGDRNNWMGEESDKACAKISDNIKDLRGKHLACFCALDEPCHADVLLKIANQDLEPSP